jgi:hypothetical protein
MARSELRQNLKFRKLQKLLKLPVPYVVGLLECMWQCGYESGNDLLGSSEDVELAAEWPGKAGSLFKALIETKFVDKRGLTYHIHDLADHAPEYVKKRIIRRHIERNSNDKGLSQETADIVQTTASNGCQTAENGSSIGPPPPNPTHITSPTQPNPTEPTNGENPGGVGNLLGGGIGMGHAGINGQGIPNQLLVQSALRQHGVSPEAQRQLCQRRDVTPERISQIVEEIKSDPNVSNIAAVLVHRLQKNRKVSHG